LEILSFVPILTLLITPAEQRLYTDRLLTPLFKNGFLVNRCYISHRNPPLYVAEEESTVSLHNTYTILLQKTNKTMRSFPNSNPGPFPALSLQTMYCQVAAVWYFSGGCAGCTLSTARERQSI